MRNLADLVDPSDACGRTYRQVNAARTHGITLGSLVEVIDSDGVIDGMDGVRAFVAYLGRDCDMTPLYWLTLDPDPIWPNTGGEPPLSVRMKWRGGFDEESLRVIRARDSH